MDDLTTKLALIKKIFSQVVTENSPSEKPVPNIPLQHGKYYGGVYNGRKFMYSELMIQTMTIEKLETFIKKQIGYV